MGKQGWSQVWGYGVGLRDSDSAGPGPKPGAEPQSAPGMLAPLPMHPSMIHYWLCLPVSLLEMPLPTCLWPCPIHPSEYTLQTWILVWSPWRPHLPAPLDAPSSVCRVGKLGAWAVGPGPVVVAAGRSHCHLDYDQVESSSHAASAPLLALGKQDQLHPPLPRLPPALGLGGAEGPTAS